MFFNLDYTADPIGMIIEVPAFFLNNSITATTFSQNLFPKWFRPVLRGRSKTRTAFSKLFDNTTATERKKLLKLYLNNNRIEKICQE